MSIDPFITFLVIFLSLFYPTSIYLSRIIRCLYNPQKTSNNESNNIVRCLSLTFVSFITTYVLYLVKSQNIAYKGFSMAYLLGDELKSTLKIIFMTEILFLGTFVQLILSNKSFEDIVFDIKQDLSWNLRTSLFAPFFEELVYRSCFCPLLLMAGYSTKTTIIFSSILFGISHFHNFIIMILTVRNCFRLYIFKIAFQCCFTTIFGLYAAAVFIRTRSFFACFICHSICNVNGVPQINWIFNKKHPLNKYRNLLFTAYSLGVIAFTISAKNILRDLGKNPFLL